MWARSKCFQAIIPVISKNSRIIEISGSNFYKLRVYPEIQERWVFCGALRRKTPKPEQFSDRY
jgi:hypothetical protein